MRTDQEGRFTQQRQVRRDRLKAETRLRDLGALRDRMARTLAAACPASADPAPLRQRTVAASAGLALSSFGLSVGVSGAGAAVDAEGSARDVAELLRRLGDPSRGGFLRSVTGRLSRDRWSVSASTGTLNVFPKGLISTSNDCSFVREQASEEVALAPPPPPRPSRPSLPRPAVQPSPSPEGSTAAEGGVVEAPPPPFTLVGFVIAEGEVSVSIAVHGEVRVVAEGDQLEGWTCVSIDRDLGATFRSAAGGLLVLRAGN